MRTSYLRLFRPILIAAITFVGIKVFEPYGLTWLVLPIGFAFVLMAMLWSYRKKVERKRKSLQDEFIRRSDEQTDP